MRIKVARGSYNASSITGELYIDDKLLCHTLELPWKNNQGYVSSIPEGTYAAFLRYDKPDKWRIQLANVPGRSAVQLHTGNYPTQIEGCVLVGNIVKNTVNSIHESVQAYSALKQAFYGTDSPTSTPDTELTVSVAFPLRRTEFHYQGNAILKYEDQGNWRLLLFGTDFVSELFRSREHIVMTGTVGGEKIFLQVPLFGGVLATATSPAGPWDSSQGLNVVRKD